MKWSKYLFIFICISFNKVSAQSGCFITSTQMVYTTPDNSTLGNAIAHLLGYQFYSPNSGTPPTTLCVNFKKTVYVTTSSNCGVCLNGYGFLGACQGQASGKVANASIVDCPIDDYAWLLIASSASIAFLKIRKKKE